MVFKFLLSLRCGFYDDFGFWVFYGGFMAARDASVVSFILVVLLVWMLVLGVIVLVFVLLLFCCGCWVGAVVVLLVDGVLIGLIW